MPCSLSRRAVTRSRCGPTCRTVDTGRVRLCPLWCVPQGHTGVRLGGSTVPTDFPSPGVQRHPIRTTYTFTWRAPTFIRPAANVRGASAGAGPERAYGTAPDWGRSGKVGHARYENSRTQRAERERSA
eukprot:6201961-Pleurochrysis_carterae.AAC.2